MVGDGGEVWRGDEAFITCLWALERYREWASRLSSPALRPLARKAFLLLSENRRALSRLRGDEELATALAHQPEPGCAAGEPCIPRQEVGRRPDRLGVGPPVLVFTLCFAVLPLLRALLAVQTRGVDFDDLTRALVSFAVAGAVTGFLAASVLRRVDERPASFAAVTGGALGVVGAFICGVALWIGPANMATYGLYALLRLPFLAVFFYWLPFAYFVLTPFGLPFLVVIVAPVFWAVGAVAGLLTRAWARRVTAVSD